MFGPGDPPYDLFALAALGCLAVVLLVGCILGPRLPPDLAMTLRWGAMLVSLLIFAAVLIVTPTTNGIVGAYRMLTLWPALAVVILLFLVWTWRAWRH